MRGGWVYWALPLSAALAYGVLVLGFAPRVEAGGLLPFDLRPLGYSPDEARAFLRALTPAGKAAYLGPVRITDTIFPILFTLTLCLPLRRWLWALPALAYGLLDLAENMAVAGVLRAGPDGAEGAMRVASALTVAKFGALAVAVILAGYALWRAWRRDK